MPPSFVTAVALTARVLRNPGGPSSRMRRPRSGRTGPAHPAAFTWRTTLSRATHWPHPRSSRRRSGSPTTRTSPACDGRGHRPGLQATAGSRTWPARHDAVHRPAPRPPPAPDTNPHPPRAVPPARELAMAPVAVPRQTTTTGVGEVVCLWGVTHVTQVVDAAPLAPSGSDVPDP
jgi:hypothetical protein